VQFILVAMQYFGSITESEMKLRNDKGIWVASVDDRRASRWMNEAPGEWVLKKWTDGTSSWCFVFLSDLIWDIPTSGFQLNIWKGYYLERE